MGNNNGFSKPKLMVAIIKGKIASIVGWPFTVLWLMGVITFLTFSDMTSSDRRAGLIISIIFELIGIILIVYGIKTKKNVKRFRRYVDIILNNNQTVIDNIAGIVGQPVNIVMTDLQRMIKKGYFTGAHIDEANREFVMHVQNVAPKQENNTVNNAGVIVITCKSCGANNTIVKGTAGKCVYCGSPVA